MAKRINTDKLIAAYIADQERLESRVETAEAEIRATLAPYLSVGTFTEQDIKPLTDKLVAAEKAEFERKWVSLADFVEDDEPIAEELTIPSYDPAADLEEPENASNYGEQEPTDDTIDAVTI